MTCLEYLGWRTFFAAQLADGEEALLPARVVAVHRGRFAIEGPNLPEELPISGHSAELDIAVGDWILVDTRGPRIARVLDRIGAFKRKAAGTDATMQVIAANVDTVFIVTSANRDFNVARLERYLAMAREAGAFPVIVITKADLVDSVDDFLAHASRLSPGLAVEALDARDAVQVEMLRSWCEPGQTVAFLGSSGVGKSTLINSLADVEQATRSVREDDQRGRHTTTARSMHRLPAGGWLIDTPGMRELQLVDVGTGLDDVFEEISSLAASCRFSDCTHDNEPDCAVLAAIDEGTLDPARLRRYHKLKAEDRRNTETIADRRSRDRRFGKMIKTVMSEKQKRTGDDG